MTAQAGVSAPRVLPAHGTRARYVGEPCRCVACRRANTAYQSRRDRMDAYQRPRTELVDAAPARAHVRALMAAGMGWRRIAQAAGLRCSVVCRLLGYGYQPSARLRPQTATALLAVTADLAPSTLVDAAPTWRRVHGMVAAGYPQVWIATQIGSSTRALRLGADQVTHAHAQKVAALAERCALSPGPSARARAHAARHGWTVDLLWADLAAGPTSDDGSDVDDVVVERATDGERPRRLTRAERAAAINRLAAAGHTPYAISQRLGVTLPAVRTALGATATSRSIR